MKHLNHGAAMQAKSYENVEDGESAIVRQFSLVKYLEWD